MVSMLPPGPAGPLIPNTPDLAAHLKARTERLVQAQAYVDEHPYLRVAWLERRGHPDDALRRAIARWIEAGGTPPWEPAPPPGGQPYPPVEPR